MKILILGGSGFLGRHLTEKLCRSGHRVHTVSRTPIRRLHPHHSHTDITLDDIHSISRMLRDTDYVIHAAGDTTPGSSKLQPSLEAVNNLFPTIRFLEAAQQHSGLSIVYMSSGGAIYDSSHTSSIDESAQIAPMSYYGAGKAATEHFLSAYNKQTEGNVFILRPANVYGPGQQVKKQFGIIPTLLDSVRNNTPVSIWGDGSSVRDYLFIDDFCEMCKSIVERPWAPGTFKRYNAGTGKGYTVLELCEMVESLTGLTMQKSFVPGRGVDVPAIVLDCSEAEKDLKWRAEIDLRQGLEKTWEWHLRC